jgi:hypothetical protein
MTRTPAQVRSSRLVALAAGLLLCVGPVMAQVARKPEVLRPPSPPSGAGNWSPIWSVLVGLLVGSLVLGVAFIPSKRGHQD